MSASRLPHPFRVFAALAIGVVVSVVALRGASAADPAKRPPIAAGAPVPVEATIDRSTPRRALRTFLDAARDGDFGSAARCLDLRGIAPPTDGADLAEELSYVLYRRPPLDLSQVPDEPSVDNGRFTVETFNVGEQEIPFVLARQPFDDGVQRWVIWRGTVKHIPEIAATLRTSAWEQRMPRALRGPVVFGNAPWQWLGILAALFVAYVAGRSIAALGTRLASSFARRTRTLADDALVVAANRPLRTILTSALFGALVYALQTSLAVTKVLEHLAYSGFILGLAWLVLDGFDAVARILSPPPSPTVGFEPDHAGDRTRRALLQRVASAGVIGVTVALLLVQFDVVRHVGLSILASAGLAGVVLGFAAQKSLAGLIAGIQLSITQPIRLGDTIFLDNEAGVVQDIFLTYAVVRFWDGRCIVVPLSRFIDQPFQNWTLLKHDLWAVMLLHVKFTAPIDLLREKARELCEANPKWDRGRCELQVSDSDMYGMVIRVMMSARSPAEAWELRCEMREGLIEFLQTHEGGIHLG